MSYYGHVFSALSQFCWKCGAALKDVEDKPFQCVGVKKKK